MKQFIVLAAVLPLLLLFMAQYALDQKNHAAASFVQDQVLLAGEQARQEGCFTERIQEELRRALAEGLGIPEEEIGMEVTETRQYRINYFDPSHQRGLIHYKITVPVERIMAGGAFLGITAATNQATYTVSGTLASERLPE